MFKNLRKYLFMIKWGRRYIPMFRETYLDTSIDEAERYESLSAKRQGYSQKVVSYLNLDIKLRGSVPQKGRVLYVINHRSLLDIMVIESLMAMHGKHGVWIAKQELQDAKLYGKFFEYSGCIPVDLEESKGLIAFFKRIKALMAAVPEANLYIFPEGERVTEPHGTLLPFQAGAAKIAKANKMSIIPIYLHEPLERIYRSAPFKEPERINVFVGEAIEGSDIETAYRTFRETALQALPSA